MVKYEGYNGWCRLCRKGYLKRFKWQRHCPECKNKCRRLGQFSKKKSVVQGVISYVRA